MKQPAERKIATKKDRVIPGVDKELAQPAEKEIEIESLRGVVVNITQQKLATTLVAFGQLVDKACRIKRPNS